MADGYHRKKRRSTRYPVGIADDGVGAGPGIGYLDLLVLECADNGRRAVRCVKFCGRLSSVFGGVWG